jgi:hypothetical protein
MKLALFFTCNVSLKLWIDTGLFDREKLLYEEFLHRGYLERVYWLTYGNDDGVIANQLKAEGRLHPDIIVLPMPRIFPGKFGALIYSLLMPLLNYRSLKTVDILKTNQMFGSWSAVLTNAYNLPEVLGLSRIWPRMISQKKIKTQRRYALRVKKQIALKHITNIGFWYYLLKDLSVIYLPKRTRRVYRRLSRKLL